MLLTEPCKANVLTHLYSSQEIHDVLLHIRPEYIRDDVKQHVFLLLFEKDDAFIMDLHGRGKLRAFVAKTIYNTVNFSESKFNREQRRRTEIPTESFDGESQLNNERGESSGFLRNTKTDKIRKKVAELADDAQQNYDYEALVESCPVKMEAIYWYNRRLLNMYVELGTYRLVAEKTGIPLNSVHHAIKKAKKEMKKLLWE